MPKRFTRRQILGAASTGLLATKGARPAASSDKPAILGGPPGPHRSVSFLARDR